MSSRYESLVLPDLYPTVFHVAAPLAPAGRAVWPRKPGLFIRRVRTDQSEVAVGALAPDGAMVAGTGQAASAEDDAPLAPSDAPPVQLELVGGQFGLVPPWVKSASDAKLRSTKLVNARAEAVTTSNNFRNAWFKGQRCIVPMMAFQDDDWRSGKAVPTRIARVDGKPMGVAGLWEQWAGADGEVLVSFALLTVNANSHALMHRYQQPGAEKRMPAVLNEGAYEAWLMARPEKAREFLRAYPANWLTANPVQSK